MKKFSLLFLTSFLTVLLTWCWWDKSTTEEINNTNWEKMSNDVSSYLVSTQPRSDTVWEDIFIYDDDWNMVLQLVDRNEPQYLFALYGNYVILDSWTSASQRKLLVYDIKTWLKIFESDYYPWENGLVLNDDNITFYKAINQSLYWEYTLPNCENEYDNGYIESYGYTIWEGQANDLGDIQCAYFE